jgi:hypothetical protein
LPAGVGTNRTSQSLTGYFGGLVNTSVQTRPYAIAGITELSTNAAANRVAAVLASDPLKPDETGGVSNITMAFGAGNSAFIDNNIYGAAESQTAPTIVNGNPAQAAQLYLLSSGAAPPPTSLLPSGASYCQCQYLQWGYWGGDITTANPSAANTPRTDRGNINFWVAGPTTLATDISMLASQSAVGNYSGHLIGTVFNNGNQYMAAGGLSATYAFATRSGSLAVNNYDGISFSISGKVPTTPDGTRYSVPVATLTDKKVPIAGTFNGSFYSPAAVNNGGNFNFHTTAGSTTYLTSGIFAAKR